MEGPDLLSSRHVPRGKAALGSPPPPGGRERERREKKRKRGGKETLERWPNRRWLC